MISLIGSLLNLSVTDDHRYSMLGAQGPFEIRLYQRMSVAKIQIQGNFVEAFLEAKKQLCDYLEGSNLRLEKIENTSLFIQRPVHSYWEVGTILKTIRLSSDIPRPLNRLIRLEEIPPQKVAVLKCSRILSGEVLKRREQELLKWISKKAYQPMGSARIIHYPNQFQLPFYKDKELLIDVL